jgi:hypothetical protein
MSKKTWGDITIEVLKRNNCDGVMWGDTNLLDEIAREYCKQTGRCKVSHMHPLDRHIQILNRLEKDKRFVKNHYNLGRSVRGFNLKEKKI